MKATMLILAAALFAGGCSSVDAQGDAQRPLKVLMIGNSFSICVLRQMPAVADSMGLKLDLSSIYIGGCSLERHWTNLVASVDADFKPYGYERNVCGKTLFMDVPANLLTVLKSDKWDIISIQQASHFSWQYESYHPWGDRLIAELKKLQPQAEIVLQETWSYTPWDRRLRKWGITPAEMYERIRDANRRFAAEKGLRIIPTGTAVDLYRRRLPVVYTENSFGGDPCGGRWGGKFVKGEDGKWKPGKGLDVFHLGYDGEYLQALVWTAALFGVDVTRCKYVPKYVQTSERADKMRQCAQRAVAGCRLQKCKSRLNTPVGGFNPAEQWGNTNEVWWINRHEGILKQIAEANGEIDLVFLGDSITHYWDVGAGTDTSTAIEDLKKKYTILSAGFGGDWCQNLLWRINHGELDGYKAKLVMLLIGTNNNKDSSEQIFARIREIVKVVREKQPHAKLLLLPIFPRFSGHDARIEKVNKLLFAEDFGEGVIRHSFNDKMLDEEGKLRKELFEDGLHPSAKGYELWRQEVEPIFKMVVR